MTSRFNGPWTRAGYELRQLERDLLARQIEVDAEQVVQDETLEEHTEDIETIEIALFPSHTPYGVDGQIVLFPDSYLSALAEPWVEADGTGGTVDMTAVSHPAGTTWMQQGPGAYPI